MHDNQLKGGPEDGHANLWTKVNGDIAALNRMGFSEIANEIFGGLDRVDRLREHFERVLSSPNNLKIAILSFNSSELIKEALHCVTKHRSHLI